MEKIKQIAAHRNLQFKVEGQNDLFIFMDPFILREVTEGLIKNAIENTPDGGIIEVSVEQKDTGISSSYSRPGYRHHRGKSEITPGWSLPHKRN